MLETIIKLLEQYSYPLIFFGTMVDQSGVPVFIIMAGVFCSTGKIEATSGFITIMVALIISDFLLLYLGNYIKRYKWGYSKLLPTFLVLFFNKYGGKVVRIGAHTISKNQLLFYIFSKHLPGVGKVVPMFVGYTGKSKLKAMLLFTIGNLIYGSIFYFIGFVVGTAVINHSLIIGLAMVLAFGLIYLLFAKKVEDINY
ncbi:membrane protein DedA with SNARE-associated domain [Desulfitispora alkaliphila]|uniref:DedA family protein n=1 Tax=Desulfitispora alkaliphila TaxID=622674 RepID=UPI003D193410